MSDQDPQEPTKRDESLARAPEPDASPAIDGRARAKRRLAWAIALAADALQWVFLPLFWAGAATPFDDVLDVAIGVVLWRLLGWHWALLPTLIAELIPGLDLVPTWTAAVWLATRGQRAPRR